MKTEIFLWSHWYPCFTLLVTCALGFKARVDIWLACFVTFTPSVTPAHLLLVTKWRSQFRSTDVHTYCIWNLWKCNFADSLGPQKWLITYGVFSTLPCFLMFHVCHLLTCQVYISTSRTHLTFEICDQEIKAQNASLYLLSKLPKVRNKRPLARDSNLLTDKEGHHAQVQLKALYICHPVQLSWHTNPLEHLHMVRGEQRGRLHVNYKID